MIKVLVQKAKAKFYSKISIGVVLSTAMFLSVPVAYADWRKEMGVFRIGIALKNGNPIPLSKYEDFRVAFSNALNMPVEIFQARDASSLIDAAASSRIDYAILSALGFATLELTCECAVPIAAPTSQKGAKAVRSVLYANVDKISSLQDLAGARVAIGPVGSLTSSILPIEQFKFGGVNLRDSEVKLLRARDLEQAIAALNDGRVDAFFGWEQVIPKSDKNFTSSLSQKLAAYPDLNIAKLWLSEPIRFGPHVAFKNTPREAVDILRTTVVNLNETAPLAFDAVSPDLAGGFVATDSDDYRNVISLVRSIKNKSGDDNDQGKILEPN